MICTFAGKTCGACCWGEGIDRETLTRKLRRHQRLFRRYRHRATPPGPVHRLLHELLARRALDLLMAPILLLPGAGRWLQGKLRLRMVCAFVAFQDETGERVGCLLHPSRWREEDVRQSSFAMLPGFRCGPSDFFCEGAHRFALSPPSGQQRFVRETENMDWFDYSTAAPRFDRFGAERRERCPSSLTKR